jgi:hypothetical protein
MLPASLTAQAPAGAILRNDGGVWLNGNTAPVSSALFLHDIVQTQKEHSAKIDAEGSTATVQSDTIVQFDGDELVLDHGGVQVMTSRGMRVRVNCIVVVPVTQEWTRFDVLDVDGKVQVSAYQNDVKIHGRGVDRHSSKSGGQSDVIVHQGEQASRDERCGAAARPDDVIDANVPFLSTIQAKWIGVAAIAVGACFGLCHGDDALSPSKP